MGAAEERRERNRTAWRRLLNGAALVSLFLAELTAALSYVNGEWLDGALSPDRPGGRGLPETTTLRGAIWIGVWTLLAIWTVFALVLTAAALARRRSRRRRRRTPSTARTASFVLNGFATARSYAARAPDWESGPVLGVDVALQMAEDWVEAMRGSDAVVEVARLIGDEAHVTHVVGAGWDEVIAGVDDVARPRWWQRRDGEPRR